MIVSAVLLRPLNEKGEIYMTQRFMCTQEAPVVQTKAGKLRGFMYDGIYTFHGIRYAKAARFQAPQPVAPWEGIRDALSYGYICPVLNNPKPTGEVMTPHRFWPENEHCQYLNVWTKSLDTSAKKPVMVWFHGGGFSAGSSIVQVCYEGDHLAKYGDVVVVSVNHRLNVFGHLDMSMFGEKYKNSVNAGIADLVAALGWIRDNIQGFGGDPGNVTIFGQSGGGGKVTTLGQVPEAAGLFHKAIVMSGVLSDDMMSSDVDPRDLVLAILAELGMEDTDADRLEKVPAYALVRAVNRAEKKLGAQGKHISWGPKPNEWYTGDPMGVGFSDYYKTVPTMVGTVMAEFGFDRPVKDKDMLSPEEREAIVAEKYGSENAARIIELFKKAYPDKNEVLACNIDTMFRPTTLKYIREKARTSSAPVYSYMFALEFDYDGGKPAWHCSDIPFVFHNADRIPICQIEGVTEALEYQVSMAWVNFARTGNPNIPQLPGWAPCTGDHLTTMVFDRKSEARVDYEEELLDLLAKTAKPFVFDPSMFADEDAEAEDADGRAWVF